MYLLDIKATLGQSQYTLSLKAEIDSQFLWVVADLIQISRLQRELCAYTIEYQGRGLPHMHILIGTDSEVVTESRDAVCQ